MFYVSLAANSSSISRVCRRVVLWCGAIHIDVHSTKSIVYYWCICYSFVPRPLCSPFLYTSIRATVIVYHTWNYNITIIIECIYYLYHCLIYSMMINNSKSPRCIEVCKANGSQRFDAHCRKYDSSKWFCHLL